MTKLIATLHNPADPVPHSSSSINKLQTYAGMRVPMYPRQLRGLHREGEGALKESFSLLVLDCVVQLMSPKGRNRPDPMRVLITLGLSSGAVVSFRNHSVLPSRTYEKTGPFRSGLTT